MANGLEALKLMLMANGIGPGAEVIVPANTYIATWLAISHTGAVPVPVEPAPRTYNLDPERIAQAITPHTRAIMPVHLYGQPADMEPIRALARAHGLLVLADAAQAHGACCHGRPIASFADATGFSFYPGKNLGAYGDAGAVVTDNDAMADQVRVLRNYGSRTKYENEVRGINSRLDPLQAAFLRVKLAYLDAWNERRRVIAARYAEALADVPDLALPYTPDWAEPVWHLYVVRHPRRDLLRQHLQDAGIGSLVHYPIPPHRAPAYADQGYAAGAFPITEQLAATVLSLPMGPHLSQEEACHVIDSLRCFA